MSDERLKEIQERLDKATPGPWGSYQGDVIQYGIDWYEPVVIGGPNAPQEFSASRQDLDFIAHAREDIPFLLAEIERLKGRIERALQLAKSGRIHDILVGAGE